MGYGARQVQDLETTINASGAELVVIGTPIDLRRIVNIAIPAVRVRYDLQEVGHPTLRDILGKRRHLIASRDAGPTRQAATPRRPHDRPGSAEQDPRAGPDGRSFLTVHDFTPAEIGALLDLAGELKARHKSGQREHLLEGRAVGMIFMKTSTRTRISFEVGIEQLGAQPLFLNANDIQLRVGETIKDTAHVLSRYVDAIMIRTFAQQDVAEFAQHGSIPVINGLTDDHHPCQAMADALTMREHFGDLKGRKLVYSGDGNNVAHSLMEVGAKTGMHVVVCTPEGYRPKEWAVETATPMRGYGRHGRAHE